MDENWGDIYEFINKLNKPNRLLLKDLPETNYCRAFYLKRDVTRKKFGWLTRDYKKGEVVYEYNGCTYGCIGSGGKAFSEKPNTAPFFELDLNCVAELPNQN